MQLRILKLEIVNDYQWQNVLKR